MNDCPVDSQSRDRVLPQQNRIRRLLWKNFRAITFFLFEAQFDREREVIVCDDNFPTGFCRSKTELGGCYGKPLRAITFFDDIRSLRNG